MHLELFPPFVILVLRARDSRERLTTQPSSSGRELKRAVRTCQEPSKALTGGGTLGGIPPGFSRKSG